MSRPITVVKVGGSLFDIPRLGQHLHHWLAGFDQVQPLLVPGGGATADVIRDWDHRHRLGEEASHWLALRALALNAHVLAGLVPGGVVVEDWRTCHSGECQGRVPILDCYQFARADEGRPGCLPHSWQVTSDSVAARVTLVAEAAGLMLLKSVDIPFETSWEEAGHRGWVDRYFARVVPPDFAVVAINFRRWCRTERRPRRG